MQNRLTTIRERVEQLFGLPAMKMPWSLYLAQLNEAGKLTARSIMDIMTIVLTSMEEQEEEIKDLKLVSDSKSDPLDKISTEVTTINLPEDTKIEYTTPKIDDKFIEKDKKLPEELQEKKA